jgi:hypothetical protein
MDTRDPIPCNDDRVILPTQLRDQLLQFYHDQVGHPGITGSLATIRRQYWWPGLRDNVETYIQSCQWCAKRKIHHRTTHVPIAQYPAPRHAFDICHLDLTAQGFPVTARGHRFILVFKCSLTRYVELVPLPNKKELTIARAIVERIYCRHGAPGTIITDRGTEFTNELFKQISILLSINRISTTGGNPRSNGLAENHNIVLKDMLAAYANQHQDDWDLALPHVAYAYNTTVCVSTGYTPFFMVYGREARQLCNEWIDTYMSTVKNPHKYVIQLANALQLGWDIAACQKPMDVDEWNKQVRTTLPFKEMDVGARFFLRHVPKPIAPTTSSKKLATEDSEDSTVTKTKIAKSLQHRWTGPYVITKKFSKILYETVINGLPRVVHIINMKPDPFGERLREHQPLPIAPLTPLPDLHNRPHISSILKSISQPAESPSSIDNSIPEETDDFKYW